jgi:hypothetical protein
MRILIGVANFRDKVEKNDRNTSLAEPYSYQTQRLPVHAQNCGNWSEGYISQRASASSINRCLK